MPSYKPGLPYDPPYDPTKPVQVPIPGIQDIFHIPALEDKNARRDRARRLHDHNDPLPDRLRWIPHAINVLDNIDDYLKTAFYAGLPLWRRLPTRMLPLLGAGLLATDIISLINSLLSLPLTGTVNKGDALATIIDGAFGHAGLTRRAQDAIAGGFKLFPFLIQAGQVLDNATGVGLRLGPIFGALTDYTWGLIRSAQGGTLQIQAPPPSDITSKASNLLAQMLNSAFWIPALSVDDQIAAQVAATDAAARVVLAGKAQERRIIIGDLLDADAVTWLPWSQTTIDTLQELGIPVDDYTHIPKFNPDDIPSFRDTINQELAIADSELDHYRDLANLDARAQIIPDNLHYRSDLLWDEYFGEDNSIEPLYDPRARIAAIAIEHNFIPWPLGDAGDQGVLDSAGAGFLVEHIAWITVDLKWQQAIVPGWRFQNAYTPTAASLAYQIDEWARLALALWCGEPILMPLYNYDYPDPLIKSWTKNAFRWGILAPYMASVLLWGNCSIHLPFRQYVPKPWQLKPSMCASDVHFRPQPRPRAGSEWVPNPDAQIYGIPFYVNGPPKWIQYSKKLRELTDEPPPNV